MTYRIMVFFSGRGSHLVNLWQHSGDDFYLCAALTDNPAAAGIAHVRRAAIPLHVISARHAAFVERCVAAIDSYAPDLIVLAGFMRLLPAALVRRYAGKVVNVHPSLLPLYPRLHTHRRVLVNGDTLHGATVHLVDEQFDHGTRLARIVLPVTHGWCEQQLAQALLPREHRLVLTVVRWFAVGRLRVCGGVPYVDNQLLFSPITVQ